MHSTNMLLGLDVFNVRNILYAMSMLISKDGRIYTNLTNIIV